MKVMVCARDRLLQRHNEQIVKDFGFTLSSRPEAIICVGGDGTLLDAERMYPKVPKTLVRGSPTCQKCSWEHIDDALHALKNRKTKKEKKEKIEVQVGRRKLIGLNDVAVRNIYTTHAIRFKIKKNGKYVDRGRTFIGDGIVVATAYGSTGYYFSITHNTFDKGLGLAFNNTTTPYPELKLRSSDVITLELERGDAIIVADNNPKHFRLADRGTVTIKVAKEVATILTSKSR